MHQHLLRQASHSDKCTERRCAHACGYQQLDRWLSGPLFSWDRDADTRRQGRLSQLLRGEMPAA